jgi:hypothetical protein
MKHLILAIMMIIPTWGYAQEVQKEVQKDHVEIVVAKKKFEQNEKAVQKTYEDTIREAKITYLKATIENRTQYIKSLEEKKTSFVGNTNLDYVVKAVNDIDIEINFTKKEIEKVKTLLLQVNKTTVDFTLSKGDILHLEEIWSGNVRSTASWNEACLVTKGMVIRVKATGTWSVRSKPSHYVNAEGLETYGWLQARITTSGKAFKVGEYLEFTAEESGMLYFGIQDTKIADNSGTISVKVEVVK